MTGWHLLGATQATGTLPLASWLTGVSYSQVQQLNPATGTLAAATQAAVGQAYWVQVSAPSTWTPPAPPQQLTQFVYDGDGGRVKQVTSTGTTTYLGESYEKDPTGKTTKYLFAGSQRIAANDSTGALRFYHGDHLGSSNIITDSGGTLVELTEYTPFGSLANHSGSANVPQKFTGQRLDETGLYFYQSRYYDPTLGRFLSPDPFIQSPADPQTLNRYSYCRNNPINLVDPSGNFFQFVIAIVIAAVKAAVVGAAVGAAINATAAAIRGEDIGQAAWRGARSGAASGALLGAGGFAIGAQGFALVGTAKTLAEVGIAAASGAVGGGVDSHIQGGSFSDGLLPGTVGGILGYGASRAIGAVVNRLGLPTPEPGAPGQQLGLMQSFRQWAAKAGSGAAGNSDDAFQTMLRRVETLDFSTGSNQAVFYSGAGQKLRAEAFASATGRLTIGMTPGGKQLMSDPLFQSLSADQQYLIWQKASAPFAKGASGKIHAFIKGAKPTGTFRTIEEQILDENPSVYGRRYWY